VRTRPRRGRTLHWPASGAGLAHPTVAQLSSPAKPNRNGALNDGRRVRRRHRWRDTARRICRLRNRALGRHWRRCDLFWRKVSLRYETEGVVCIIDLPLHSSTNAKCLEFAAANTRAAMAYAQSMSAMRSPTEFMELTAKHAREQFETLTAQMRDLTTFAQQMMPTAGDAFKTPDSKKEQNRNPQ
jgi:hypothetical protein